jgi:sugar-specific transcriptional regulator TrmB
MKLIPQIKKIGFSDKEARIYLQLIYLGPQTASVLSRHTAINRTTVYDILEALKKRGIVQSISKSGSTSFKALHPKELIAFLEREKNETLSRIQKQQDSIEELLPELISLEHAESTKPKVTFFEGEKGMREAYEDTLTSEGDILAYANVADMHAGLPHFFPEYYQRRAVEYNVHIKAIMPDNKMSKLRAKEDKKENRESTLIPAEEFEFSPEINIYNNKVLMASWREKLAIIIESKEIADFHRKMYKLAWEGAKHLKN